MLFNETMNSYNKMRIFDTSAMPKSELIVVKEYGEYQTNELNIRIFNRFEFKGYLLMMVLDGSGIMRINYQILPLSIGDFVIFNCDSPQIVSNNRWKVCYIALEGENLYKIIEKLFGKKSVYHFHDIQHIYQLYKSIYQSIEINDYCGMLKTNSYILRLLADIVNYDVIKLEVESFETKVLNYIEDYYTQDIGVEDMAYYCGYSKFSFIREFKKTFNNTPYNYLCSRRIAFAKELLSLTDLTIEEISEMVGFNSVSNFCVAFKRNESMTPREYYLYNKKMIKGGA